MVEKYVYDFNRFISPGGRLYCCINLHYDPSKTSPAEIEGITQGFKKPRIQFMQKAFSDAPSPIQMGSLTGSVKSMATSPDFLQSFKKMFQLKHLGLWWTQPKSELSWSFSPKKFVLHYEIDRSDLEKMMRLYIFLVKTLPQSTITSSVLLCVSPRFLLPSSMMRSS